MLAALLAVVSLLIPVVDMQGKKIDDCRTQVGTGGTLTLMCSDNEPILLDYKVGPKERLPKIRVERVDKKVKRIEILPAPELDWRPVAYTLITVGAVLGAGKSVDDQEEEQSASPWR